MGLFSCPDTTCSHRTISWCGLNIPELTRPSRAVTHAPRHRLSHTHTVCGRLTNSWLTLIRWRSSGCVCVSMCSGPKTSIITVFFTVITHGIVAVFKSPNRSYKVEGKENCVFISLVYGKCLFSRWCSGGVSKQSGRLGLDLLPVKRRKRLALTEGLLATRELHMMLPIYSSWLEAVWIVLCGTPTLKLETFVLVVFSPTRGFPLWI